MRYTIVRDHRVPSPRKLAWAAVGLGFALVGSAALGWQNGGTRLRSAVVEEVDESDSGSRAPTTVARPAPAAASAERALPRRVTPTNQSRQSRPASRPRTVDQRSTAEKILGFRLPSFSRSPDEEESAPRHSTAPRTRAGAKALGTNANPRVAPPSRPRNNDAAVESSADADPSAFSPRIAPRVADPANEEMEIELPPVRSVAPSATRPEKATSGPAPSRVAEAKEVTLPKGSTALPHRLAPLEIKKHTDVRAAGFQNVTPGETKLSGVAQALGTPAATDREGDTTIMTYQVGPFPSVEVVLSGDLVDSVIIHLKEPVPEKAVLAELGLQDFVPVEVVDMNGEVLGRAIPERGVAVSYHGPVEDHAVGDVVLAKVTAEPFVLRALANCDKHYTEALADASYAAAIDPTCADAFAIQSRIHLALGRFSDARTAIEAAIQLDPGASDYRLLYARMLSESGDYENAVKMVEGVASTASVPPEFVAQAELQWGDLLAHGPERDYPKAVEHHTRAIKLATPLALDADPAIRRAARRILIDANLAVARDVALGNYKRKSEVVPKWIAKAEAAEAQAIEDGASAHLRLHVAAKTLAAYSCLSEPIDPTAAAEAALREGQDLIGASEDPLHKQQLEWTLGIALLDAVQVEHARGEFEAAMEYASNALALLKDNVGHREVSPHRDYAMARVYFSMGALHAVGKSDHAEAVHYYLQAIPLLDQPLPADLADEQGRHAERFVSMGVSFWQNGNKAQAVDITLRGTNLLQEAVDAGQIEKSSLAVPYANLAAMYKQLGNGNEAKRYTELAQRLDDNKPVRR